MKRFALLLLMAAVSVGCGGVRRPFDVPEYVELQNHETGFQIPMEGATVSGQKKFDSAAALEKHRVAIKRIQIPHRWSQTGRIHLGLFGHARGEYIDNVRLVVVNRSPVTREWTADEDSGTERTNQAVWLESNDSISFSLGFNCTAFIREEDATDFLYMYPTTRPDLSATEVDKSTTGLAETMDKEIRARVQMLANHVAAQYDLDDLRAKKQEILNVVRNGVPEVTKDGVLIQERLQGTIAHFAERGITISNLGQFGGFEYEDAEIQGAINETFIKQQDKVKSAAALEAQVDVNKRIELEAEAIANKERTIAQGNADAVSIAAAAEAQAITLVATAAREAGKEPLFLELKKLEVEDSRIQAWDGAYPTTMLGGKSPGLLMQMPSK